MTDEQEVVARLTAEAEAAPRVAPPFLARRILRATVLDAGPTVSRAFWRRFAAAVVTVSLVVAAAHYGLRPWSPSPVSVAKPSRADFPPQNLLPPVVPASLAAAVPAASRLLELGQSLDQPLQAEWDAVVQDARDAMQFVASSLLPEGGR